MAQRANIFNQIDLSLNFLHYTLPDWWWVDITRLGFVVVSLLVATLAFRVAKERGYVIFRAAAWWCTVMALVELEQLGRPFVPWRLPAFWIVLVYSLKSVKKLNSGVVDLRRND